MKKVFISAAIVLFSAGFLSAHPATALQGLGYSETNEREGTVRFLVMHKISQTANKDRKVHYIKTVTVSVNGKEIKTFNYTDQQESVGSKLSLSIPKANAGDVILVKTTCSLGGDYSQEITVEKPDRRRR